MIEVQRLGQFGLRTAMLAIGLALCAWAISDDYLIGGGPGFGGFQALVLLTGVVACVSASLKSSSVVTVLVIYLSVFGALTMVETMLSSLIAPRYASVFELDDRYLYKLKPEVSRIFTHMPSNGSGEHVYTNNSQGFRGDEIAKVKAGPRIVVYGDSFIHAIFSPLAATFTERLEKHLSFPEQEKNIEVINAGVAGYGPDQILRRIEDELFWLQPDILIVSIYSGNDFGDLVRNKIFRVTETNELELNDYTLDPEVRFQAELSERELLVRKVFRSVRDRIQADGPSAFDLEVKVSAALEQQVNEYEEFVDAGNNVVKELRSDPYSADISLLPEDTPSAQYKIRLMEAVISRISAIAQEHNTQIFYLILPHPIDVLRGTHSSGVVNKALYEGYTPDRLTDTLMRMCTKLNQECVNLMDTMRREGGIDLYLNDDDHWNDKGQDVAAKYVADYLQPMMLSF